MRDKKNIRFLLHYLVKPASIYFSQSQNLCSNMNILYPGNFFIKIRIRISIQSSENIVLHAERVIDSHDKRVDMTRNVYTRFVFCKHCEKAILNFKVFDCECHVYARVSHTYVMCRVSKERATHVNLNVRLRFGSHIIPSNSPSTLLFYIF